MRIVDDKAGGALSGSTADSAERRWRVMRRMIAPAWSLMLAGYPPDTVLAALGALT